MLDHNKMFVTDKNGVKRRENKFEISRREEQLFHQCVWLLLEKSGDHRSREHGAGRGTAQ